MNKVTTSSHRYHFFSMMTDKLKKNSLVLVYRVQTEPGLKYIKMSLLIDLKNKRF